ncbi:hypothetical protein BDP27DRAFT_1429135 [Rhodocollybia butyracea]|uniref:F-box domain-containing protein n=1 Tax=Rhodocollybia butyracea TaxID=206335 RepID=A0A9P5U185_9AGAR|nr:hypothetical protein BDP27DRAFT_1429135 [Rhodocollybia butyracea]
MTSTSPHLPWETLRMIFLRAAAPGMLVVPDSRPRSAWNLNTKTKLHLISVCKDWYEAAISLLYEDVAIYSMVQLGALVSSLYENPSLAAHVVSLRLATYIPATDLPLFQRLVEKPINICSNLRCFSFEESFLVVDEASPRHMPTAIEVPLASPGSHQLLGPELRFITAHWEFPVLDTLASIIVPGLGVMVHLNYTSDSVAFINAHGQNLEALLLDWPKGPFDTTTALEVIATLSNLRHLIIPPFLDISASQVHWLDCFLKDDDDVPTERLVLFSDHVRQTRFPNLLSYRVLASELVRKLPLLPTLLPPATEECRFTFPGVDIRCDTSALSGSSALAWDKEELDYSSGGSDRAVESDSDSSSNSESMPPWRWRVMK